MIQGREIMKVVLLLLGLVASTMGQPRQGYNTAKSVPMLEQQPAHITLTEHEIASCVGWLEHKINTSKAPEKDYYQQLLHALRQQQYEYVIQQLYKQNLLSFIMPTQPLRVLYLTHQLPSYPRYFLEIATIPEKRYKTEREKVMSLVKFVCDLKEDYHKLQRHSSLLLAAISDLIVYFKACSSQMHECIAKNINILNMLAMFAIRDNAALYAHR